MKEIGGYMEFERLQGCEYHPAAIALNYGRNCLAYLIEAKSIKKVYLPIFLCDSVKTVCERYKVKYDYYHIDEQFHLLFDGELKSGEYIYIVNYYGTLKDSDIIRYKERWKNIIIDNTQDFFRLPVENVDTLYTCRKYFGVSDGAYLYTDTLIPGTIEPDCSNDRIQYLLGRYEKTASEYYEQYLLREQEIPQKNLLGMSKVTHNILRAVDYEEVKNRRTDNFKYLHAGLKDLNKLQVQITSGAFAYPLYIENAKELRKKLIEQKIYVPVLWPDVIGNAQHDSVEYRLADGILPLPCDQRYGEEEMQLMVELILQWRGSYEKK